MLRRLPRMPPSGQSIRQPLAGAAIFLALLSGAVGWFALADLETGASSSLGEAADALSSVETSLRSSTAVATATADALDAAATSLESASATSQATAQVALEVAEVTATLPPYLTAVSSGLGQIDATIDEIDQIVESLPFNLGADANLTGLDPQLQELDSFVDQLGEAEASLRDLSAEAARFVPDSEGLAMELRRVADELRVSIGDLDGLADSVDSARTSIDPVSGDPGPSLLPARLTVLLLCLAVAVGKLPDLLATPPVSDSTAPNNSLAIENHVH